MTGQRNGQVFTLAPARPYYVSAASRSRVGGCVWPRRLVDSFVFESGYRINGMLAPTRARAAIEHTSNRLMNDVMNDCETIQQVNNHAPLIATVAMIPACCVRPEIVETMVQRQRRVSLRVRSVRAARRGRQTEFRINLTGTGMSPRIITIPMSGGDRKHYTRKP